MLYRYYKLFSEIDDEICYIGKTKREINKRFNEHKSDYKQNNGFCYSKKVFEKYGIDNVKIETLEEIYFENKYDADKKEKEYIESFKNCCNFELPTQTKEDRSKKYREKNKEKLKKYHKNYYQKRKNKSIENCVKEYEII